MVSNIVTMNKNNENLIVYIEFIDINAATPKDEYLIPVA